MKKRKLILLNILELFLRQFRRLAPFSSVFLRAFYLSGLRAVCVESVPASTQFDGPVEVIGTGNVSFGEYCRLGRNVVFETNEQGEIIIGQRVRINAGTFVTSHERIYIGDDSLIGEYVSIRDANHGTELGQLIRLQDHKNADIKIGRDVWIGRGCCILQGVSIGDGAIVGANSVITKDVPENAFYAGVSASFIKAR